MPLLFLNTYTYFISFKTQMEKIHTSFRVVVDSRKKFLKGGNEMEYLCRNGV